MPVAPTSQQFESTCPRNSSTKVCVAIQPVVGQHRDRVGWNPLVEGIEWYRFQSVRIAIEVSRMKKADTSGGRCLPELGMASLESARRGESNGIGFGASAWL